ncbi:hypothetical protein VaNZ11_009570 [Volvox africanus]|uniref:Uncharacterized protein n=1 Tax=Volvox africanus TaxID=51714 RepID=A0ABQ5S811_9CHLO|nr:hypothetical protein VaNZ11_009570 [Volvox africanus]
MVAKCRAVRALLPSVLNQVEQVIGRRFSFDARTVCAGFDGFCNLFEPQGRPLSSANLGGHTILFTPSSLCELQKQLAHFRACKRQHPDTSACILLPEYVSRRNPSFLSGMQRVLRFNPGTALFHSLDMAGEVVQCCTSRSRLLISICTSGDFRHRCASTCKYSKASESKQRQRKTSR